MVWAFWAVPAAGEAVAIVTVLDRPSSELAVAAPERVAVDRR